MKRINIEDISFRLLYYKYKEFTPFFGIIVASILLLFFFIIPQVQEFFSIRAEEQRYRERNKVLQDNLTFLQSINDTTLDSQYAVATSALSAEKDYAGIMNSISVAAEKANVSLGDFSFRVGDLSTKSAALKQSSFLLIEISVDGPIDNISQFVTNLYSQLPLAEISEITLNGRSATIKTAFSFKGYAETKFELDKPLHTFTAKEQETYTLIQKWSDNSGGSISGQDTVSSSSGLPSFTSAKKTIASPSAQ